ncbi:hypothetical protein PG997_010731 [Apiospora hydei]|uniref:Uncharacterized protein n=1 Tax=Apiospora hydei TaxID=1337664 RepID=A0ABR1VH11_9PEZI
MPSSQEIADNGDDIFLQSMKARATTFTRQKGVEKHAATTHVGTTRHVLCRGHATGTEAGMKAHLKAGHQRSHEAT